MGDPVEVVVGVVGRAHGIRGEVAVDLRTDEPERRFAPGTVLRGENDGRRLTIESARDHSGRLLVRFAELADRTAVEGIRGLALIADVPADERPDEPEEYYDRQLVGLTAVTASGQEEIGPVLAVLHLGAQDALEIGTAAGARLVPFVAALVPEVDLIGGRLTVVEQPGLLTDEPESDETEDSETG